MTCMWSVTLSNANPVFLCPYAHIYNNQVMGSRSMEKGEESCMALVAENIAFEGRLGAVCEYFCRRQLVGHTIHKICVT